MISFLIFFERVSYSSQNTKSILKKYLTNSFQSGIKPATKIYPTGETNEHFQNRKNDVGDVEKS